MKATNYRFIGLALLVGVVMFLYLDGGTMTNSGTNGMMRQHGWMIFNGSGLLITLGITILFVLITFLLFRKNFFHRKD